MQLSTTLQGVISQTLLPRVSGGRVAAHEIMVCLTAIANLIRESKTHQMASIIQSGSRHGMHTLDQHLSELVAAGMVTFDDALAKAQDVAGFESQAGQFRNRSARIGMNQDSGQPSRQLPGQDGGMGGMGPRPSQPGTPHRQLV